MVDRTVTRCHLSIVIVNWKSAPYVLSCVASIVDQTRDVAFEIIVIDNASFDSCEGDLWCRFPDVVFVQSPENVGFGGANNLAASKARGDVVLFLNPDTVITDRALDRLWTRFTSLSGVGVMGCRLLNTDGSLQTSCVQAFPTVLNQLLNADILRRLFPRSALWGTSALLSRSGTPVQVQAVSGACMMIRRELFEALGGFSPVFFMYGEDIDLCARASGVGLKNAYVGDCEVIHHGGGSTRKVSGDSAVVAMCESVAMVLRRTRGPVAAGTYRLALTLSACLRLFALSLIAPVGLAMSGGVSWRGSTAKWLAVLSWGTGFRRGPSEGGGMWVRRKA